MSRPVALLLFLCVVTGGLACRREEAHPAPTSEPELPSPVAGEPARRGNLRAIIHTSGVVTPLAGAEFVAMAPGPARILDMPYTSGDRVASGDLLVRFDMPSAVAEVSRQQAAIARAQARLENARVTQSRSQDLAERGIISRREMQDADTEVADAQAEVTRGESVRATAEKALARAVIRAPFAGLIAQRLHNPGDVLQAVATDPILRLIDPDRLDITAQVTATDAPRILPGAAARTTSVGGPMPVRLTVVSRPTASSNGTDALVHLVFAEPTALAVDTRVEVEIDGEEHINAVLIHAGALVEQDSGVAVFVAANGTAERRLVTTGLRDRDLVEITSGLEAGEIVITRGQVGLSDGEAVSVDAPSR